MSCESVKSTPIVRLICAIRSFELVNQTSLTGLVSKKVFFLKYYFLNKSGSRIHIGVLVRGIKESTKNVILMIKGHGDNNPSK